MKKSSLGSMHDLSNPFTEVMNRALELMNDSKYEIAEAQLRSSEPNDLAQARMRSHYLGKILLRQGDLNSALKVLLQAEHEFGPHVGLSCDIATAYYRLERMDLWERRVHENLQAFQACRRQLSDTSRLRTCLALSKDLEELANINEALVICETILSSGIGELDFADSRTLALLKAQALRLHVSFFEVGDRARSLYRDLLMLRMGMPSVFHSPEIQHALVIAEFHLIGPALACSRLKSHLSDPKVDSEDKRLTYYDLLLESLVFGRRVELPALNDPPTVGDLGAFESFLEAIHDANEPTAVSSAVKVETSLTLAQKIHLWHLTSAVDHTEIAEEIRRKIDLVLGTLPKADHLAWSRRLSQRQHHSASPSKESVAAAELKYHIDSREIERGGVRVGFQNKPGLRAIFEALIERNAWEPQELARRVWECEYDLSHYERLRVSCQRINALLKPLVSDSQPIRFSKDRIEVNLPIVICSR